MRPGRNTFMYKYKQTKQLSNMKQKIIIPEAFYTSASIGGFEYPLEKQIEVLLFFHRLVGLKWHDSNHCICIDNGEISAINLDPNDDEGWTDLLLEWSI